MVTSPFLDFAAFRHRWGWYLALGIALVILGVIAFLLTLSRCGDGPAFSCTW
jgi:uncharacterized membrane protein HdeD (DUF308 family)